MKISTTDATNLFVALGLKAAKNWKTSRLATQLKKLPELADDDTDLEDKHLQKVLKRVLKASKANEDLELEADEEPETEVDPVVRTSGEGGKEKKKKEKKPATEKDRFGTKVGSVKGKINEVLDEKEFKTMKQLCEESGVPIPQYNHINTLIGKGWVEKDEEGKGYRLTKNAPK
jgi:hypothetical protein